MKTRKATIEATLTRALVVVGVKAYRHPQIFFCEPRFRSSMHWMSRQFIGMISKINGIG